MVAPVTGPYRTVIGDSNSTYYQDKSGYKQARPFTLVTTYETKGARTEYFRGNGQKAQSTAADLLTTTGSWTHLTNACYDQLKDSISSYANVAVNLAESNRSLSMVRNRLIQMYQFGNRLARFDFLGAARVLRMATVPKRVSAKRSFANNYLEYHFGWSPLIGDIYSGIDILQNPVKDVKVRAVSRETLPRQWLVAYTEGSNPSASNGNPTYWKYYRYRDLHRTAAMGTEVAVTNPNLHLANSLGLVNPAIFIYEKIPFSFVADWFFNVEQFLSMGTDFYGLTLKNTWHALTVKGTHIDFNYQTSRYWSGTAWVTYTAVDNASSNSIFHTKRQAGLITPQFQARPWKPWGWRRTAAAASLLVQQLSKS